MPLTKLPTLKFKVDIENRQVLVILLFSSMVSFPCQANATTLIWGKVSFRFTLGSLSKSLLLALIRLPEVNFPQNETLRMYLGCIQL